jgi:hypothetical protein
MLAEMGSLRNARGSVYNAKDKALLVRIIEHTQFF